MAEDKPFLSDRAQYVIGGILSVAIAIAYILLTDERTPTDPGRVTPETTEESPQSLQLEKVKDQEE